MEKTWASNFEPVQSAPNNSDHLALLGDLRDQVGKLAVTVDILLLHNFSADVQVPSAPTKNMNAAQIFSSTSPQFLNFPLKLTLFVDTNECYQLNVAEKALLVGS